MSPGTCAQARRDIPPAIHHWISHQASAIRFPLHPFPISAPRRDLYVCADLLTQQTSSVPRKAILVERAPAESERMQMAQAARRLRSCLEDLSTQVSRGHQTREKRRGTYWLILLATFASPVSFSASILALSSACCRSSALFRCTSS
jgi:hypothetical protein